MARRGEVLVAIMNNLHDWRVAQEEHWYRIPVSNREKWLKDCWPPQWLAFYMTKPFGEEAYAVHYYARVLDIRTAYRWELLPDQPRNERSTRRYYQLMLSPLQRLARPIVSRRWRRIVFIPTTREKFLSAVEINDLYDESVLEDRLWAEFKRLKIVAERQEWVPVNDERGYFLDFAIYCASGKLDVETDGDTWHAVRERIPLDNLRDNDLETAGWKLLRFNTKHIDEQLVDYCLPTIVENVNRLGGLDAGYHGVPTLISPENPEGMVQRGLFDARVDDAWERDATATEQATDADAQNRPSRAEDTTPQQAALFNDESVKSAPRRRRRP